MPYVNDVTFSESRASRELITQHLVECDSSYSPPLSSYVDIHFYADKLFERASRVEAYVADLLVGLLSYYVRTDSSVYVSNLSVLPRFHGLGLASKLLFHLKTIIIAKNCRRIELEVYRANVRAVKFYLSHGFFEVGGTNEKIYLVHRVIQNTSHMTLPILVGRPNIGSRRVFDSLVDGIFERRWFTNNGQIVKELERRLCEYLGVRHCIPVCNATIGLQVVCHALDLKGEVLVPAFTFVATPHSVHWEGLEPVFVDIDPATHLMDAEKVEALITPRTSAILGVHAWGRACHPERLQEIADRHGLQLYFDAAHAFGCSHGGMMIGNYGRCEVFSFHATKFFNTFEGGAIATNDDELAARMRLMINFGFTGLDTVVHLGTNGKMSEIHAAMGLACFESLDEIVRTNRSHYDHYRTRLSGLPGVRFLDYDDMERTNFQYIAIEIDADLTGLTRDELMHALHEQKIMARRYFFPGCHRMEPYASLYHHLESQLPVTDAVCERVLILPTGTGVERADVDRVCAAIQNCISQVAESALSRGQ